MAEQISGRTKGLQDAVLVVGAVELGAPLLAGAAGAVAGSGELVVGSEAAATEIPTASNGALQNTIKALFRAGDRLPGGTAGAIHNEALTGQPTGGVFHLQKGIERIANLTRILAREELSAADRATAEKLLTGLKDAVKFAQEQAAK